MADQSALSAALEVIAAILGFLSSAVLLATAYRAVPLQDLLERADKLSQKGPGGAIAEAVVGRVGKDLRNVRVMEWRLLIAGTVLLMLSFACTILSFVI